MTTIDFFEVRPGEEKLQELLKEFQKYEVDDEKK